MRLVDSQIHLWADADYAAKMLQTAMSAEQVLAEMDAAGIARTYLVPGHTAANGLCRDAARRWPDRFRALALLALDKPESRALMDGWSEAGEADDIGFVGVRVTFPPYRKVSWLDDGTADWLWPIADRLALPVMIWAPLQAPAIDRLAAAWPRVRFIVDHLNLFVADKGDTVTQAVDAVLPLARHANIAVKVSSLPAHSNLAFPWPDMHPHVQRAVQAFGAERALWATDLTRRACSAREAVEMFTRHMPFLDAAQLEQVMGGAATQWIGWQE